jgi:hypothetical protein
MGAIIQKTNEKRLADALQRGYMNRGDSCFWIMIGIGFGIAFFLGKDDVLKDFEN